MPQKKEAVMRAIAERSKAAAPPGARVLPFGVSL